MSGMNTDEVLGQLFAFRGAILAMIESHPDKPALMLALQEQIDLLPSLMVNSPATDATIESTKTHLAKFYKCAQSFHSNLKP